MEHSQRGSFPPDRRIALLIDADNIAHGKIGPMLSELSKYGVANIRRAYGDWTNPALKGWEGKLHEFAIRPIQQFNYSKGKNATDIALVIDAMELLYTQKLDGFCIASSDGDFTPLVMQLRANGHDVYGFGERKTPDPFVNACTTLLFLDSLGQEPEPEPVNEAKKKPTLKDKDAAPAKPVAPKKLSQDAKLVSLLRGAVEATAGDNGWALLSTVGSAVKRQAPIDPRNYGVKNFIKLFEATELFEIVKPKGSSHSWVADRRNKDRAPTP